MNRRPRKKIIHSVRSKRGGLIEIDGLTRSKAIKVFCSECFQWEGNPIAECTDNHCPLFPYRGRTQAAYGTERKPRKERKVQ